ncbi:MAG: hypothetical protein JWQ90_2396 [Hydrocarboniphaga sp.]|uniref:EthD domain-containing protein n=1 Tax=Hydrocarboniphaga sp. TaxID=2033016 RepID=UPI0026121F19|nr:EthD domain-containing protein [Hydrocarboniphaga sp.]MDB5969946.1 hypothetical protein [Hydrocarboniphaga sp.]
MFKIVFCLHRLEALSHQDFLDYWYGKHAPLVRQHAETTGLIKYVQSHGLAHPVDELLNRGRKGPAAYDGVAELYYRSAEALLLTIKDRSAHAAGIALLEDEKRFIDLSRSPLFVCEERAIIPRAD